MPQSFQPNLRHLGFFWSTWRPNEFKVTAKLYLLQYIFVLSHWHTYLHLPSPSQLGCQVVFGGREAAKFRSRMIQRVGGLQDPFYHQKSLFDWFISLVASVFYAGPASIICFRYLFPSYLSPHGIFLIIFLAFVLSVFRLWQLQTSLILWCMSCRQLLPCIHSKWTKMVREDICGNSIQ